ncbi:carboxymuconolactone decarboxylase family protein [Lactococcus lactis]|uniref:carboxymuconolactone decarboxylase family protein n=1 Tax=Lactococcus lactis TaxID=1358 RepID=UPI0019124685|nr:carboxymuconolactone decarboxylase family protein [Lactococcus lactis]MBK5076984.1 carboxymuconolactone decarboxylase family protein [Lactococcus lactis]
MIRLDKKQINLITTAVYATLGKLDHLKSAFTKALDEGMTINEAKEAMLHVYAYAGFPRSINATNILRVLVDDRAAAGKNDVLGVASSELSADVDKNKYGEEMRTSLTGPRPQPAYAKFSPTLDDFLKEHLFADLFTRQTLSKLERELITISVLAALKNVPAQLETHTTIAQNVGLTDEQTAEFNQVVVALLAT